MYRQMKQTMNRLMEVRNGRRIKTNSCILLIKTLRASGVTNLSILPKTAGVRLRLSGLLKSQSGVPSLDSLLFHLPFLIKSSESLTVLTTQSS